MAVYTDVSAEELGNFLAGYDLGELLSYKGIAEGVENSNFLVHTGTGYYILTLYEKRVAPGDVPFFLALMSIGGARHHLPATGQGPQRQGHSATMREACRRRHLPRRHVDATAGCRPLRGGRRGAGAHAPGGGGFRRHAAQRAFCCGLAAAVRTGRAAGRRRAARHARDIETELDHLEKSWPRNLPQGVIHADLFPDNVFFLGDRLSGLIDFYFACTDTLAFDIAICLTAWCFEPIIPTTSPRAAIF